MYDYVFIVINPPVCVAATIAVAQGAFAVHSDGDGKRRPHCHTALVRFLASVGPVGCFGTPGTLSCPLSNVVPSILQMTSMQNHVHF